MEENRTEKLPAVSYFKRGILANILRGVLVFGVPAISQTGCFEDMKEATTVRDQYKSVAGVKDFLTQKSEQIKKYAEYDDEEMAQEAPKISGLINDLIKQLETAKSVAESISKTNVRFSPVAFDKLLISLRLAERQVDPSSERMLNLKFTVDKLQDSIIYRWGAKRKKINPDAVIRLYKNILKLSKTLNELDASVRLLINPNMSDSCSSNSFVSRALEKELGDNFCNPRNTLFCQAMNTSVSENGDMSGRLDPLHATAVQQRLIVHGLLRKGQDDGAFGRGSKAALSKGFGNLEFITEVRNCKK